MFGCFLELSIKQWESDNAGEFSLSMITGESLVDGEEMK